MEIIDGLNMISTFVLILLAFSAIYVITYNNVESKIEQSLYRTFSFHRAFPWARQQGRQGEGGNNQHRPQMSKPPQEGQDSGRQIRDFRNFSVYVDNETVRQT